MLQSDLQRVRERQQAVADVLQQADELLAAAQPSAAAATGEAAPADELVRARALYDEALALQPLEISALANRGAALLWLREPYACKQDCDAALVEMGREEVRRKGDADVLVCMFPAKEMSAEQAEGIEALHAKADKLRF